MSVKLLTEHHFEFLSLKGGYTGSSEPTLVKIPHCWKSHGSFFFFSNTNKGNNYVKWAKSVNLVEGSNDSVGGSGVRFDMTASY